MPVQISLTKCDPALASDALHIRPYSDSKVLYRSDTLTPLSVVSNRYNVV